MAHPLITATRIMANELNDLSFGGEVACIYNPLDYAWELFEQYLIRYGTDTKRVLFLGMNPGPYGMVQTGVPFGEIDIVSNWLKIKGKVDQPKIIHPKRPIDGFDCRKSEVSGKRFWGMLAERFPEPYDFFDNAFVVNFCPLVWMTQTGKNITPDKLSKKDMQPVYEICNRHLKAVLEYYQPEITVGIGAYAEKQLNAIQQLYFMQDSFQIGRMLHPSPASPIANKFWPEKAIDDLQTLGVF